MERNEVLSGSFLKKGNMMEKNVKLGQKEKKKNH